VRTDPESRPPSGGERQLAEALWLTEYAPMVRLARLLGAGEASEDVVQDAFARVVPRLGTVSRPGAYLRTAVVNGCRALHRHAEVVERHRPEPPSSALPEHLVDFADALEALPDGQRAAIVLRHYVGLPDDEIAALLSCRRSTVRSLVRRGLAALREVIEP
jgi:RNA polymerase sigma factor (sigma-70 family)